MADLCSPCQMDFDYLLRFEGLSSEEPAFLGLTGLGAALPARTWINRNAPEEVGGGELADLYFGQLSAGEVEGLYRVYEMDFRMFGYTFEFGGVRYPK